ncbi:MAG: DUF6569 family protein, partial [Phycisphaeraceae bacterium]|nr:DUF6569 family protein [Phycisphaeraceae bacterium]
MANRRGFLGGTVALAATGILMWAAWTTAAEPERESKPAPQPVKAPGGLTISGPFTHENLSVFLIHSDRRDDREFLTLEEGLKAGLVTVSEKKSATVRELIVVNKSDKPLFLQEGDRITGGKQDRTIYTSLAIKPRSGPTPIPSFCVEASRWRAGEKGSAFVAGGNKALAPKSVRYSAKISKNQGRVWKKVAAQKQQL